MKHLKLLAVALVFFSALRVYSGSIVLYKKSDSAIPKESMQTWNLNSDKRIYIYYQHDDVYSANVNYRVSISKKVGSIYVRQENKEFPVQKGKKDSIVFFDIAQPGNYIVSIIDEKGYIIGEQGYTVY
jgi:hypothetical protein